MSEEIIIRKDDFILPHRDTVTIPRKEYNDLIAAKAVNDMILAVAGSDGYGCAEIVKGLRSLDSYRKALTASEERCYELANKHDEVTSDLMRQIAELKDQLRLAKPAVPEAIPHA